MKTESASLLVVEDNLVTGDLLARCLRARGHGVVVCGNGKQAIELVTAQPFDLVLLDVGVPGADGFEVLRALRIHHAATALPIIMATAFGQSELVVRALDLGASDYVTKPYDLPVLLARVQTQLSVKRMVEQRAVLERSLAERNEQLELANLRLSEANECMKDDLQAAARIQMALLPAEMIHFPGLQLAWAFRPSEELAGDTLNVFALDRDHVGLYLLDVCGHGVPAALLSVHLSLTLSPARGPSSLLIRADGPFSGQPVPPSEVIGILNKRFDWAATERFCTLFYGVLNRQSGEFHYACAGHPGPAHVTAGSACQMLPPSGPPVGIGEHDYKDHQLHLRAGDRLYLYSDGVTEAADTGEQMYGKGRLAEVLLRHKTDALKDSVSALMTDVEVWSGGRFKDDVSLLAVEYTGGL